MIRRDEPNKILLRVYGEGVEQILNRAEELDWFTQLSKAGVGPRLLATFANGRFEEYIESVTLTPSMMRAAEVSEAIAVDNVAIPPTSTGRSIESFGNLAPDWTWRRKRAKHTMIFWFENLERWKYWRKSMNLLMNQRLPNYRSFFDHLMTLNNNPIVPCHNDLQHGNILLTDTSRIVFIDYEVRWNELCRLRHCQSFCEWASDFTDDNPTPHLMNFTEKYPNSIEQSGSFVNI